MEITKEEIFLIMSQDVLRAKKVYEEYWYSWSTIGGKNHEGVIWENDCGTYIVLCTDGKVRAV